MNHWDNGRRAALRGEPKKSNPFNNPDRQKRNNERNASLWDEGWEIGHGEFTKKTTVANPETARCVRILEDQIKSDTKRGRIQSKSILERAIASIVEPVKGESR